MSEPTAPDRALAGIKREFAVLSLENVSISFGGIKALECVDLALDDMDLAALIGPNGAGKTTAFNVITAVYRPTSGRVVFRGNDITRLAASTVTRLGVARTFQNIRVFRALSVLDNVRVAYHYHSRSTVLGAVLRTRSFRAEEREIEEKAMEFLRIFGLASCARAAAGSLPHARQRRLEIARALATEPRLLLLDEPAAGLNNSETTELMEMVRWLRDEFRITILLIEHDMRFVMGACDRITVLDHGRVIARGAPADVRADPAVIEAYLGEARPC